MRLNDEEKAMLAGAFGPLRQWAMDHQVRVGTYLKAPDFVPVMQAHIMADTESLGVAGVEWMEGCCNLIKVWFHVHLVQSQGERRAGRVEFALAH